MYRGYNKSRNELVLNCIDMIDIMCIGEILIYIYIYIYICMYVYIYIYIYIYIYEYMYIILY